MISGIEWNKFIIENKGSFLQSWEWGEFQESLGRKVWRLGDCENWAALVVRHDLPFGKNYLYCPGGPVIKLSKPIIPPSSNAAEGRFFSERVEGEGGGVDIKNQHPTAPQYAGHLPSSEGRWIFEDFLEEIKNIAKQKNPIFLKIEPFIDIGNEILKQVQDDIEGSKFVKSDGGQNILQTLVLDLNKTEEELLAEMKQKTRYNIKLAEKHGVKIRISDNSENDFKDFWNLAQETSKRDGFKIHPKEHYKKLLSICHPEPRHGGAKDLVNENEISVEIPRFTRNDKLCVKLFLTEYQSRVIAANIAVFFGKRATYLHGASSNEYRNLMAPYLLQWEQIKEAKKRGCEIYDFWGIDEEDRKSVV